MPTHPTVPSADGVLLRLARADEEAELVGLAALDTARPLAGPALVAEQNGTRSATRRPRPPRAAAGCCPVSRSGRAER
jgi:hypothetical protein